jgi:fatty-acyl-CoA synthase
MVIAAKVHGLSLDAPSRDATEDRLPHPRRPQMPVLDTTVGGALRTAAERAPDAIALIAGTPDPATRATWTYAELLADAERAARALLARF